MGAETIIPAPSLDGGGFSVPPVNGLTEEDVKELSDHGVTVELAQSLGAVSSDLGITIPWVDVHGSPVPVTRIRPRQRVEDADGEVRKLDMPSGTTPGLNLLRRGTGDTAYVIEGFLQSLAVASWAPPDFWVFAMNGADGIHARTDLSQFKGHRVSLLYDADAERNEKVRDAMYRALEYLGRAGAKATAYKTPGVGTTGADDVLARTQPDYRTATVAEWFWDGNKLRDRRGNAVAEQKLRLEAIEEAKRQIAAEALGDVGEFDAGTLAEILARPPEPPYRIEGLMPSDSSTLIVAQRKVGKTTYVLNLAQSLISGDPFLGRFPTLPIAPGAKVGVLNYEVGAQQVARWADRAHVDPERLYVVNLRGRRNPLAVPDDRAKLAEQLRSHGVESLIVDVFGRAFSGTNQNDPGEVSAWLVDLDVFARGEVGARDLILTAHAGWQNERTRGASSIEDWPDSIIMLTKTDTGSRFMSAFGRDVEIDEDEVRLEGGRLLLTGNGNRVMARDAIKYGRLVSLAEAAVAEAGELTGAGLEAIWRDQGVPFQNGDGYEALKRSDRLERIESKGRAKPYRVKRGIAPITPMHPSGVLEVSPQSPLKGVGIPIADTGGSITPPGVNDALVQLQSQLSSGGHP